MFEHLDDTDPPTPNQRHREAVLRRGRALRRRRLLAQASGSVAAAVALLIAGAAVMRASGDRAQEVRTAAPGNDTVTSSGITGTSTPTTLAPAPTSTTNTTALVSRGWSATPTSGPAGTEVSVSGGGCAAPGDYVQILLNSENRRNYQSFDNNFIQTSADGSWQGKIRVPLEARAGGYILRALCIAGVEPHFAYEDKHFSVTGIPVP